MQTISKEQFLQAFAEEWISRSNNPEDELLTAYGDAKPWTNYVFRDNGLIDGVAGCLRRDISPLIYSKEIYTVDAMFVGGKDLFRDEFRYPSQLLVLIEHENGSNVEEEMWKLIFWRCPLKVLIFYDWNEYEKSTPKKKNWLPDKLKTLRSMLDDVDMASAEPDSAEYLFLVGNREHPDGHVNWRWTTPKRDRLEALNLGPR